LDLHKEVFRAKYLAEIACGIARRVIFVGQQVFADLAGKAATEADQAFAMLSQKLFADARLVIEAMKAGLRGDLDEVAIAFFIFRQHQEMIVSIAFRRSAMIIFLADVKFAANDGLDACFGGLIDKLHRAIDVAVIRHGDGSLSDFFYAFDQPGNAASAIKQGIIGMKMKMNELRHGLLSL